MYKKRKISPPVIRFTLLTLVLSTLSLSFSKAQDIEFIATADPGVMNVGEQFTITYESNQKISDFELPPMDNFQFLGGPSVGQSTQIESSPGKTYTKTTYTYTYYFRAVKQGKYTVAPASAKIKGKNMQSNALNLEVVGSNNTPAGSGQNNQNGTGTAASGSDDVYVRLLISKNEAYVGEQIVATVKLYTKLQISGIDQRYKGPDFTGFYTEPIEIPPLRNLERENVDGEIYYTGVIQKVLLIPQKAGDLAIEPFGLDVSIRQQVKRRSNNFFDDFFEPAVQDIPMNLKSKRVVIKSKSLPADKPASFTGAVGSFTLATSVDKVRVKTNDAVNYKVSVKGTGNYKILDEPAIEFPPDIEKYDPVIKTSSESPMAGNKTFEYLLLPHYPGTFTIPSVAFTYFDIQSKKYKTLYSENHTITVEKGEGDTLLPVIAGMAKEDVKLLGSDIQYIKLKSAPSLFKDAVIIKDFRFYLLYVILLVISGLLLWLRRNQIRRSSDLVMVKNRKANKYARKRLKKAASMLKGSGRNEFYDELLRAIWLYLSDKLGIPIADLSKDSALSALAACNIKEETTDRLFGIISDCEIARYAPSTGDDNAEQTLDAAIKLIVKLQEELK
jgi:hypothetical protein